jgi:hypothetical protein
MTKKRKTTRSPASATGEVAREPEKLVAALAKLG